MSARSVTPSRVWFATLRSRTMSAGVCPLIGMHGSRVTAKASRQRVFSSTKFPLRRKPISFYRFGLRRNLARACLHPSLAQQKADAVSDCAFQRTDGGHLEAGGPPTADGDERLGCADGKVGGQRDYGGGDDRLDSSQEEEGNDGEGRTDGGGERAGASGDQRVRKRLLAGAQPLAGQCAK